MRFSIIVLALFGIGIATSDANAAPNPSRSCNQTVEKCVADRVATGSSRANAYRRCDEILAKCKKR